MLKGKKILLGVTGSIAAYKSAILVRNLIKEGAEVRVIMTRAASDFISPLTLSTLSKHPVSMDIFKESTWENHVMLGRWADLMVIAPLSCNTLAKLASGACDNLLMAVYLSAVCPVMVAPAMDEDMWKHPSTKKNLLQILEYGHSVISVKVGELASGLFGEGRMAEPEEIVRSIETKLSVTNDFTGKKVLVTAGPTYEAIDPVRFVGNHSSGKMGIEIAKHLKLRGAEVNLILGPVPDNYDLNGLDVKRVQSAEDMYKSCIQLFPEMDIAVMAAAVADYTPVTIATEKIKKKDEQWSLTFKRTRDILKSLGEIKKPGQLLVGFALETTNERENAKAKLQTKNADLIVLNSLNDPGAGFKHDTNKITIFDNKGRETSFEMKSKQKVAQDIVESVLQYLNEK